MSEEKKEINCSIEIEVEKHEILEKMSDAFDKKVPDIITEALLQYIEHNEWKIAHVNKNAATMKEKPAENVDSESIFDKFTGGSTDS